MARESRGPRCPNHRVQLTDCKHGIGICPISGARFSYEGNEEEKIAKLRITSSGKLRLEPTFKVKQLDGSGG